MIAPNRQKNQKNLPKRYLAVYSSTKNPVVCFVTVSLRKTNEMKTRGLYCIPSITQRISKRILSWYPSKPILPLPKACKQQWMMSFEQQSYQYTPCHPRPFYITGQSLLDMKNVRCLASHNNANCNNMLDDGRDDSWQIPLGTDPTKSWVQLELPKPVFMSRIVILKQFNGEYNFLLCMPCLHLGNQSRRVLGTCYVFFAIPSSNRNSWHLINILATPFLSCTSITTRDVHVG